MMIFFLNKLQFKENRFNKVKKSLSKNAELVIPDTSHTFQITIDASFIGLDGILLQPNSKNKIQTVSYNSEQFQHTRRKSFNIQ